jgi:class 3 adenylate cyclase
VLAIVNADGTLLFSKASPERFGAPLKSVPLVERALRDGQALELWPGNDAALMAAALLPHDRGDELFLVMGRSIATAQGVVGAVVAGEPVSQSMLPQIEDISHARVAFATDGGQVAVRQAGGDDFAAWVSASGPTVMAESGKSNEVFIGTTPALAIAAPIPGLKRDEHIGRAYLFRSLREELGPFNDRMRMALAVVLFAAVLISSLVAAVLSQRMTRPLSALEKGARKVRQGDLSVTVAVKSKDEIGHLAQAFNEMTEGLRQRDQIKATFKRYLAPAVVEELLKHPEKLNLGGRACDLSILFSDLVGFTSLSEGRDAKELVSLLNEYFDEVGQAIVARGGTLDKFAGDSVMCFFGAPIDQADHNARALLAGLDHLRVVDAVRARWQKVGRPLIDCRIGINSGPVIVGNIGSRDGQDYTVIGDAVNLASRLEGANKEYGTRFMVSEAALEGCADLVEARELDLLRVKGKTQGVRVFEVAAAKGELGDHDMTLFGRFKEALADYRGQRFKQALDGFRSCLALNPKDGPSETFEERCEMYIKTPPPAGWDGVWGLTSK